MPPKRKRGSAEASRSTSKEPSSTTSTPLFLSKLVSEWKRISKDKTRCVELLNALSENKCLTLGNPDHVDCYWLLLATHAMNRLVQYLEAPTGNKQKDKVATVLATLCHSVATSLLVDKTKLERLTSKQVRSIVGRAMVTVTIGSLTAISHTQGKALWASVLALDMVVFSSSVKLTPTVDGWHHALTALQYYVEEDMGHDEECADAATKLLKITAEEKACLTALEEEPPPTPSKRRRAPKKKAEVEVEAEESDLQTSFQSLLSCIAQMEGRVSMRRWSSMAFVWLANGQERVMQICLELLQKQADTSSLLEISARTVATSAGSSPAKKSKKSSKTSTITCIAIPAKVALVTMVSRLFSIVAESASNGGPRPPAGGMDLYVQTVSGNKKKVSQTKPDIRDLAVVTIHALLQAHAECLPDNAKKLSNDDESTAVSNGTARFCPFVHKSIESLCRSASAESTSARKLLSVAACLVLSSGTTTMDAKLCNFAVGQFQNCFSFLLQPAAETQTDDLLLVQSYQSLEPLPKPTLPKVTKKKRKEEDCTFGGLLEKTDHPVIDQALLPLFFRALPDSPAAIFSLMLDMLEACYDTTMDEDANPKPVKSKGKKKKLAPEQPTVPRLRRLNAIRAGLASDVCNVLRCLTTEHSLQSYFRSCLSVDQLCRFVRLTGTLETILTTTSSEAKNKDAAASFFHPSSSDFNLYERTLWSSHTNLCFTLGRGTLLYSSTKKDGETPILGDAKTRLAVFQEIPKSYGTNKDWPLHLPASYHALVTSNLTSEPFLLGQEEPEEFLVSAMIRSISKALADPSLVTHLKWLGNDDGDEDRTTDERAPLSFRDARLLLVAITRLPHKDQIKHVSTLAKALASSFGAYQKDDSLRKVVARYAEISQFLARVVTVYAALLNVATVDLRDALFEQVGPSQFPLPPLYTLGSILSGVIVKDGNWYRRESCFMGLFSDWESPAVPASSTKQSLPNDLLRKTNDILDHALNLGFQCARKDFGQLLFATWNAAGRKLTWDPRGLNDSSIKPFTPNDKSLSTLFLELRDDVCNVYLQINSNDRASLPNSLLGQTLKGTAVERRNLKETLSRMLEKAGSAVQYLMDIVGTEREFDDIELALLEALPVYIAFIMAMHTTTSDTMFSKTAGKKKVRGRKRRKLPATGSGYDIELLASIMSDDDSVCSEDDYDYQEGNEESKIDALSRLHDSCNSFGAAPIHPDWLDTTCSFREGISALAAGQNAAKAIACLTKLGSVANTQHTKAVKMCMSVLAGKTPGDALSDTAANLCCMAIDSSNGMMPCSTVVKETEFQQAVASVFEIPFEAIQDFYNDSAGTGWRAAKEAWIPNCPQQIIGTMQSQSIDGIEASNGEYRAGGEWEMLMSEALAGACAGCGMDDSDHNIWKSFDAAGEESSAKVEQVFDVYIREERWLRISQGVVSQLMPAAALLRFSAAAGNGRDTHPLNVCEGNKATDLISFTSSAKETAEFATPMVSLSGEHRLALLGCISFLAHRSARSNGDDVLKRSCFAVAANLLVEAQPCEDIEGIEALSMAVEVIDSLERIVSTKKSISDDRLSSFRHLIELSIKMLRSRGNSPALNKVHAKESEVLRLLASISSDTLFTASVLGVARFEKNILLDNETAVRERALKGLIFILCGDDTFVDEENRASVASMLGEVVELEGAIDSSGKDPEAIRSSLMRILSSLDASRLKKLVELSVPAATPDNSRRASEAAIGVSKVLALALGCDKGGVSLKFCRKVFGQLQNRLDNVSTFPESRESSLGVLFLYACRVGSLDAVGSSLVNRLSAESLGEYDVAPMECLLSFVQGLRVALRGDAMEVEEPETTSDQPEKESLKAEDVSSSKVPRACSHVLRNGFFQQHWYNCYTCGLVFDKGCCTLCALVCHKGHEVAYSRSSSFFCDCGAEVASAGEQNRAVCKCLSVISTEEAEILFKQEKAKNHLSAKPETSLAVDAGAAKTSQGEPSRPMDLFVNVAATFSKEAATAVETIKAAASQDSWVRTVFGLIKDQSQEKQSSNWILSSEVDASIAIVTRESIAAALLARSGTPLELQPLESLKLMPIRAARAGSFNVKMSVDSTTDRVKRAMLSRHGIVRSAVVADSRGRLIVAEPSALVFCSVLPAVNTRYVDDPLTTQIGRAQMSVVASHAMAFNVVGMRICRENERHVVVWGSSEACLVVLKKQWDGVERTINLDFDLDPHDCDSDYLLRCDWVPGSQTHVSVACGTFVKIYDIASADSDDNATPLLSYSIAYEAVVKDVAWVSLPFPSKSKKSEPSKRKLMLFLLMDTGRLHEIQLQLDSQGEIDGHGSSYLERSSRCIDIPTVGVRPYEGVAAGKAGSSTRSMGEGCSLCFLPQLNMLLYKCVSSCVVALSFDETGEIKGSFELLPNRVDSEVLANGTDTYSITGPFTHWTELGMVDEGVRLVCVGKSSRTNQPKLLCVDVKEKSVKVKEITWSAGGSVGLGLSLSSSFEGLAAFSAPVLSAENRFVERLCLCVVTSNGSLLIYGEDMAGVINNDESSGIASSDGGEEGNAEKRTAKPSMALTIYEDLLNVSEVDELRFAGDGIGSDSDSIKAKLSSKNSIYLMSPSRDGCTITVALEGAVEISKLGDEETPDAPGDTPGRREEKPREQLVIVALRLLVGSTTTDCLPSRIFVQGRPVDLTPDVKRWYDLPLTLEEVVLAVRNGFVSIGLGPTFESGSNPLVDAVEVYAIEKKKIQHLIPKSLEHTQAKHRVNAEVAREGNGFTQTLVLTTRILSFLYQIVAATLDEDTPEGKSLKHLIRSTALNEDRSVRENVVELLERVESDSDVRQKFLDGGTILGMSEALQVASDLFRRTKPSELEEKHLGRKLKTLLEASLTSATAIALSRPENYVSATEQLASEGLSATSIALNSSDILLYAIQSGVPCQDVLENVVHLVLAELSIGKSHTESAKAQFATFAIISKLLKSEHQEIVERCCEAITSFVETHSPALNNPAAGLFNASDADQNEQSAPIAYQCDSCSKFPIIDTRYTLLEDVYDIDLCTKCYQLGRGYAERVDFSANSPVIINGRSIGGVTKLSCAQIKQMQSVPIANGTAIVEQVEQALQEAKSAGARASDAEDPLRRAIQRSQPEASNSSDKIVINFDTFTGGLFDNILGLVGYMLEGSSTGVPIGRLNPLLTLLLDSISMGANGNAHVSRGKRYAREVLKHTRRMLGTIRSGPRSEKTRYVLLINFLRSLGRLTGAHGDDVTGSGDDASETGVLSPEKVKGKTDPRFVCDAHGVPAVRRRCSNGGNKNKRFYVCGMERKQRCKYFKWADESKPSRPERAGPQTRLEKELELFIWQLLSDASQAQAGSLSDQLCDLMETEFSRSDGGKVKEIRPSEVKSSGDQPTPNSKAEINSLYDREAAIDDFQDGVFCSKEKVGGVAPHWLCKQELLSLPRELLIPDDELDDQILSDKFIEASLDLVSTVASATSSGEVQMPGHTRWFSLLCEVISMNPASRFRPQAKKALKRMCGGNRTLYHCVRDHYVFGFQFKEIFHHAYSTLDGALCVREQARQCGEKWNEDEVTWNGLAAGELLGTLDLIPEDCLTVANSKRVGSILDELLSVTKSRVGNWRHFCSLLSLPMSYRQRTDVSLLGQDRVSIEHTFGGPPILSLFWLCCSISGPNQVKVMKMIDLALTSEQERRCLSATLAKEAVGSGEVIENIEGVSTNAMEIDTDEVTLPFNSAPQKSPEDTLVNGPKALSVEDIFAFSLQFVLGGRTPELRRIACQVASKLCRYLDTQSLARAFSLLVDKPMAEIESLGCSSVQYLQLLQSIVKLGDWNGPLELTQVARKVAHGFTKQMNLFRWMGGKGQFSSETGRDSSTKRFDMTSCVYCHRVHHHSQRSGHGKNSSPSKEKKSSRDSQRNKSAEKGTNESSKPPEPPWLPDQVRPFVRGRLENSTDNTCSSECSLLVQLKCRLSISEIHATVNDPRGRYAKTIVVSFTPRQVSEVTELKSGDYDHLWQECATISLSRGATHASCTLPIPVTVANLKFEYRDFYDRAGGSRAADGSFLLFCPRCSRQVNNAHGVCGSCGECVFQCRRCRHIQYDRPDAFLCTECGHCSSGSFSYELSAGVASNAVAIVDDECYKRTVKVSRVATKLHGDLQTALVERVRTASRKRSHPEVDPLSEYSPAMKRALMGDLPKLSDEGKTAGTPASDRRNAASTTGRSGEGRSSSNAANRARSLLRLARQLRTDGDRTGRNRELLVREAFLGGREFSLEEVDDDGADIVGLFGSSDRGDTLTRLVASITGRRAAAERNSETVTNETTATTTTTGTTASSTNKKESGKSSVQECEKLHQLMREAERECYELQRRLNAWNRLERDCLPETNIDSNVSFAPTKCSRCAGPVTLHLLLLMLRLVQSDKIADIESVITKDFVRSLFLEPPQMLKDLFDLKRLAITTFCMKSEHAAKLILEELRARLRASSDEASASILGKLLEHDFSLSEQFVALATETLDSTFII